MDASQRRPRSRGRPRLGPILHLLDPPLQEDQHSMTRSSMPEWGQRDANSAKELTTTGLGMCYNGSNVKATFPKRVPRRLGSAVLIV